MTPDPMTPDAMTPDTVTSDPMTPPPIASVWTRKLVTASDRKNDTCALPSWPVCTAGLQKIVSRKSVRGPL